MRVQLIGKSNGVGLSRDFELLAAALRASGCEVTLRPCEKPDRRRRRSLWVRARVHLRLRQARRGRGRAGGPFDANVMLEHVWPQFLQQGRCNVVVPNPEWFDGRDVGLLPAVDRIWAKTGHAQRLFEQRGRASSLIGFASEDRYLAEVPREPHFLHLAGRSPLKGTARLLQVWRRHPEWPPLWLLQDSAASGVPVLDGPAAPNVHLIRDYVPDETLRGMQNSHRFHICLSEAEGWGHYVAEAMSVGAVTLTCDAPPMNELVGADRGILVGGELAEAHGLTQLYRFDEAQLEAAVHRLLAASPAELERLGARARAWILENNAGFSTRVRAAVHELGQAGLPGRTSESGASGAPGARSGAGGAERPIDAVGAPEPPAGVRR